MDAAALAQRVVDLLVGAERRLAVAESCTAGAVSAQLALADGAGSCLEGGIVAYDSEIKQRILGVEPGPVVSRSAAEQMATGVARVFGTAVGLSTTGVVGPARQEGQPVGRVWVGIARAGCARAEELQLPEGLPAAVRAAAVRAALDALLRDLTR